MKRVTNPEIFSLVWIVVVAALVVGFGFLLTWMSARRERHKLR